jgi:hypothetical protein
MAMVCHNFRVLLLPHSACSLQDYATQQQLMGAMMGGGMGMAGNPLSPQAQLQVSVCVFWGGGGGSHAHGAWPGKAGGGGLLGALACQEPTVTMGTASGQWAQQQWQLGV